MKQAARSVSLEPSSGTSVQEANGLPNPVVGRWSPRPDGELQANQEASTNCIHEPSLQRWARMYKKLLTVIAPGRKTQRRVEKRDFIFLWYLLFSLNVSFVHPWASLVAQTVKKVPAVTGATGDSGLIPGSGRSLGNGNPLQNSFFQAINYIF